MAQQNINNGDTGLEARNKINQNDTELYERSGFWQILINKLSNILQTVDYISLFAKNVEVVRVGDGTNPKVIVDPAQVFGNTTGYWFGDGDTGIWESSDNVLNIGTAGNPVIQINAAGLTTFGSNPNPFIKNGGGSAVNPVFAFNNDLNTGIGRAAADELSNIAGGIEVIRCKPDGAYIQVIKSGATQAAAGANPNEMWKTSGHATLPDNVIMHGV